MVEYKRTGQKSHDDSKEKRILGGVGKNVTTIFVFFMPKERMLAP